MPHSLRDLPEEWQEQIDFEWNKIMAYGYGDLILRVVAGKLDIIVVSQSIKMKPPNVKTAVDTGKN